MFERVGGRRVEEEVGGGGDDVGLEFDPVGLFGGEDLGVEFGFGHVVVEEDDADEEIEEEVGADEDEDEGEEKEEGRVVVECGALLVGVDEGVVVERPVLTCGEYVK